MNKAVSKVSSGKNLAKLLDVVGLMYRAPDVRTVQELVRLTGQNENIIRRYMAVMLDEGLVFRRRYVPRQGPAYDVFGWVSKDLDSVAIK